MLEPKHRIKINTIG